MNITTQKHLFSGLKLPCETGHLRLRVWVILLQKKIVIIVFVLASVFVLQSGPFNSVTSKYFGSCWFYHKIKATLLYQTTHFASNEPSSKSLRETFVK